MVSTVNVRGENGEDFVLEYCLLEDGIKESTKKYGVKSSVTDLTGRVLNSCEVCNLFYVREEAEKFIEDVLNMQVMPVTLKDVITDAFTS